MLKNYILVALRNIRKNKVFSTINILGLALGMTCSLLILLWVQDEEGIDGFHRNKGLIYSVYERQYYDGKVEAGYYTPGLLPDEMKRKLPEIQYSSGFAWKDLNTFSVGDKIMKEEGNHASTDYFKMFSYPLIEGNAETALSTPVSMAISRKMAVDFFGSPAAAIGKTIRFDNRKDMTVSAVFENLPASSSDKFDYLINWHSFLEDNDWAKSWGNNGPRTLIQLRKDANPALVEKKITHFLDDLNKEQGAGFRVELGMYRFSDIYLHSNFKNGKVTGGRIDYLRLFILVAVFILVIACINFMNLTTARSVKRAKEIGIRKVVGALRTLLMRQFIGEAILLSFLAVLISMALLTLLLPTFSHITGKEIGLPFTHLYFWISLLVLTVLTGVVSGSYPAIYLSAFNPVTVLKGTLKTKTGALWFRKGLVIFQFVLSIVLIIGMIVISKQVSYVQNINLGYDKENLIYIPIEGELMDKYNLFKEELLSKPGIQLVTRISQTPTQIENGTYGVDWDGKDQNSKPMFTNAAVGFDFVKTMKLEVPGGRDFSKDFGTDTAGYILNESALKKIGYKDPVGKRLTLWGKKGTIIGIVKDFHFNSLREPIQPLILRLGEKDRWGSILVRTMPGKTKEALASMETVYKTLNPKFPFTYQFSDQEYQKLYKSEETVQQLSTCFAFLGIFISCLGLLGLAMFTAEQRTKEIGIRKVLGASVPSIFTLLSKEFLLFVLIAFAIASPLAWWAMYKWLQDFAYRVVIGWWIFAVAGLMALLIALLTISFQAIRAAVANPAVALKNE
ncbi:MAG TPA: ABC transporter permease [Puia sp.]|nr:ABC transporter permease [Puia sp.]